MTVMAGIPESADCGQDEEPVGVEPGRPSPEQVASEAPVCGLQDLRAPGRCASWKWEVKCDSQGRLLLPALLLWICDCSYWLGSCLSSV
jgi:hypothetical protein